MSVNTMRFRVRKAAGSPSVKGASGIETLASHACNPCAHPDYLRKGSLPQGFDRTEHLAAKLDHCVNYLRRAEVISSKLDYERTKTMNLTDSASNYASSKGTLRYVVTSYILHQVLTDLGLTDTDAFFRKSHIVNMSTVPPSKGLSEYVPGYDVFKALNEQVQTHVHDVTDVTGAMNVLGFERVEDTVFRSGITYYTYNIATHTMDAVTELPTPGTTITGVYYRKVSEKYNGSFVYTVDLSTATAGQVSEITIPDSDIFEVANVGITVDLVGSKSGATYIFSSPMANIVDTTDPEVEATPLYVAANSLVCISQSSSLRKIQILKPYGWLDVFPVSAVRISDMDTIAVRITVKKLGIA